VRPGCCRFSSGHLVDKQKALGLRAYRASAIDDPPGKVGMADRAFAAANHNDLVSRTGFPATLASTDSNWLDFFAASSGNSKLAA
jgi:hypothetical protein